jgi:hypothetical protein
MRFTEYKWSTDVPENLKPYSAGGFKMRRYWACIRGGRTKHTLKAETGYYTGDKYVTRLEERVFLAASSFNYTVINE